MTEEEFKEVEIGDFLIEDKSHLIEVDSLTRNAVVYWEKGYFHEVCREYLSRPQHDDLKI